MKIPRTRIRTTLVVVALVAVCLGAWLDYQRRSASRRMAVFHAAEAARARMYGNPYVDPINRHSLIGRAYFAEIVTHHEMLAARYHAAMVPLSRSVPPDPPVPDITTDPAKLRAAVMRYVSSHMAGEDSLYFGDVSLTDADLAALRERKDLVSLTLCGPHISAEGLRGLRALPDLKYLTLINCGHIPLDGLLGLRELRGLKLLTLENTGTEKTAYALARELKGVGIKF